VYALAAALVVVAGAPASGRAQERLVQLRFTPTARAQIAVWIERDGALLETLALTRAVAYRGIGNRPGALQMNSGFRWPFGRREGVLPVWAHRRAAAPGALPFSRVVFQSRSEGAASGGTSSVDDYFCLSFRSETTRRDALDAVSCASTFNSDKGRYLTADDVTGGYAEPFETAPGAGIMRALDPVSLYPPRRDLRDHAFVPLDSADAPGYLEDTARVMPELDAVTMATPPGRSEQTLVVAVPAAWPDGAYEAWVEVSAEGDYDPSWDDRAYPTPRMPAEAWDGWAIGFGYPYRGQPSVVYRVPFELGAGGAPLVGVADPIGYGSLHGTGADGGEVHPLDATIANDPVGAPGSGADRLLRGADGLRLRVRAMDPAECMGNTAPGSLVGLEVTRVADEKHSHDWAHLAFRAPHDDTRVARYEVRVGTEPIVDEASFLRAQPANAATLESEALELPADAMPGALVESDFGALLPLTHYYVGARASDDCAARGPIATAEVTTTEIHFTVVSPCFVATAAYGTPTAPEVGALRRWRDRHLRTNAPGRALVALYYAVSPPMADAIRPRPWARGAVRALLAPLLHWLR